MSESAGRAVTPAGLPAAAGAGGAAPPARQDIGQSRVWLAAAASYAAIGTVLQVLPPYTAAPGRARGVRDGGRAGHDRFPAAGSAAGGPGRGVLRPPRLPAADPRRFATLLASSVLLAAVPGFGWLLAARAAGGVGAGPVMVGALKMLAARVPTAQLGGALGVFVAGLPIGTVVAFDVIAPAAGGQAWRAALTGRRRRGRVRDRPVGGR